MKASILVLFALATALTLCADDAVVSFNDRAGREITSDDAAQYPAPIGMQSLIRVVYSGKSRLVPAQATPADANPTAGTAIPRAPAAGNGLLFINEIMADNDGFFADPDEAGAFEDWFEVYNPGTVAVDMSGMYITDNLSNPTKWQVPSGVSIPAKGYLVFLADSEPTQGPLHTNFALSADGESLAIYQSDGTTLVDSVTFGTQQTDVSLGRTTDGASTWSIFQPATPGAANTAPFANWISNAASYLLGPAAPASIVSFFGENLAASTVIADSSAPPTTLGGVRISVTDSGGTARQAPLYFVSGSQVNFQLPAGTVAGRARLTLTRADSSTVVGDALVDSVAPGIFSANASGQGIGLIGAIRVDAAGAQTVLPAFAFDTAQQAYIPVAIDLGDATSQVYLTLYATGVRGVRSLGRVSAEIDGEETRVTYAAAQPQFAGVDQINIGPIPRALVGKGEVPIVITVDGRRANSVTVSIQ